MFKSPTLRMKILSLIVKLLLKGWEEEGRVGKFAQKSVSVPRNSTRITLEKDPINESSLVSVGQMAISSFNHYTKIKAMF